MNLRFVRIAVVFAVVIASVAASATANGPGACPSDTKLLNGGPTSVYGEGPGTWWGLVINGLLAAGLDDEADQIAYLNATLGTQFGSLAELEAFNVTLVSDVWDTNQNGYVCAFELRGKHAYIGDPYINLTYFGVSDDRIGKN